MDITGMACSREFIDDLFRRDREVSKAEKELRHLVIMEEMEVKDALKKMLVEMKG